MLQLPSYVSGVSSRRDNSVSDLPRLPAVARSLAGDVNRDFAPNPLGPEADAIVGRQLAPHEGAHECDRVAQFLGTAGVHHLTERTTCPDADESSSSRPLINRSSRVSD